MAYALVAQVKANGNDTFATGSIDTTGANLLVATFADTFAEGSPPALTDSKSNTWVSGIRSGPFGQCTSVYYAWNPIVGTGHTFTLTGTDMFGSLQVEAFSGSDTTANPLDDTSADLAFGSTTVSPGSVLPTTDGQLVVTHITYDVQGSVPTINGGFVTPGYGDLGSGGAYLGSATSYLIQTTAAAANPTWTTPGNNNLYCTIATFKAGADTPPVLEVKSFHLRPPGRIAPGGSRLAWFGVAEIATGAQVTGTAAADLGTLTAVVVAVRTVDGVVAASFGTLTATAGGTVDKVGTAAAALGTLTAAASGLIDKTGTASTDLGAITATVTGLRTVTATAVADLGALTATGTDGASGNVNGTAIADLGALTATATAARGVDGTATADLGALTATGTGQGTKTGVATADLGTLTAAASGLVDKVGTAAAPLGALAATIIAVRIINAIATANLGALTATAQSAGLSPDITGLRTSDTTDRIRTTDTVAPARTTVKLDGERTTT